MWLLLAACGSGADREVAIVEDDPGRHSGGPSDSASADTGADSAEEWTPPLACQTSGDPLPGTALELQDCVRLSPEAAWDVPDDTAVTDTAAPSFVAPPPCGFENLVGDIAVAGEPDAPVFLYCDADADGGVRIARLDGDQWRRAFLAPEVCTPDLAAGDLLATADGFLAMWAAYPTAKSERPGIVLDRLDPTGAPVEDPWQVEYGPEPHRASLVGTEPPTLLSVDYDGNAYANVLDLDAGALGPSIDLGPGGDLVGVPLDGGLAVVVCGDDSPPTLQFVRDGKVASTLPLAEGSCGWSTHPGLATDGASLLATWDDGAQGAWALIGADTSVVATARFAEKYTTNPQPARVNSGWVVFADDGALTRLDDVGTEVGTWWHPYAAAPDGSSQSVRLHAAGDTLTFVYAGLDAHIIGGGHVNTYNFVELSRAAVP